MRTEHYKTKLKEDILRYFAARPDEAVTAKDVYEALLPENGTLSITTVYRNLDRMVEDELLVQGSPDGGKCATYLWAREGGCYRHLHLQCIRCGRVLHLECADTERYIRHLAGEHDFNLLCGKTVLFGECSDCRKIVRPRPAVGGEEPAK